MAKVSRPVMYLGLFAVVVSAWILTSGEDTPTRTARKKKPKVNVSKNGAQWLPEDYDVNEDGKRFAAVNEPMRNAFKPLVARQTNAEMPIGDMGIPVADPGWIYTGMADIDGVPTALLENTRTGDGVFLKQGESWKGIHIQRIAPEELVVVSSGGVARTVKINAPADGMSVVPGGGFQPVNPPIRGPIGGGLAVQPDGNAGAAAGDTRGNRGRGSRNANRTTPGMIEGTGDGDEN